MTSDDLVKLTALINSAESSNIELALSIAKTQKMLESVLLPYRSLGNLLNIKNKDPKRLLEKLSEANSIMDIDIDLLQKHEANLGILKNVKYLELADRKLKNLPKWINTFKNLIYLEVSDNKLQELPNIFSELNNINFLYAHNNKINKLPGSFFGLKQLESLGIRGNPLTPGPEFGNFSILNTLDISSTGGNSLPSEIIELTNLVELKASGKKMSTFNSVSKSIADLCLSDNCFETMPEQIFEMRQLEYLDFSDNRLDSISDKIEDLSALIDLRIYNNRIKKIPDAISKLKNLKVLLLSNNRLTTLPESIFDMSHLEVLDLSGNKFDSQVHKKLKEFLPNCKIYI